MSDKKQIGELRFSLNRSQEIYFDSCTTSLKPQCIIHKINEYYTKYSINPHNIDSDLAYKTYKELKNVRCKVAKFINAPCKKLVIFTSGTTFSYNQIAYGISHLLSAKDEILTLRFPGQFWDDPNDQKNFISL